MLSCRILFFATVNMIYPTKGWVLNFFLAGELVCFPYILCLSDFSISLMKNDESMFHHILDFSVKKHHLLIYSTFSGPVHTQSLSLCDMLIA